MVPLSLKGIALDPETQMPIVLLENKAGDRIIPIGIGPFEASSIIVEIENLQPLRPLTHDLLVQLFNQHGFKMEHVEIYDECNDIYFARIHYRKGKKRFMMEVRPSDGIALAIRLLSPIYAAQKIIDARCSYAAAGFDGLTLSSEMLYINSRNANINLM